MNIYNILFKPIKGQLTFASKPIKERIYTTEEFNNWVKSLNISSRFNENEKLELTKKLPFLIKYKI